MTETRLQVIERLNRQMHLPDPDIDYLLSLVKECRGVIERAVHLHDNVHLAGKDCLCVMNESARQTLAKLE